MRRLHYGAWLVFWSALLGRWIQGVAYHPAMADLQRITTEYIDIEDRIRLAGPLVSQAIVALWLTQRLLNRLVPHLLGWLEQQSGQGAMGEVFQGFALQAAMATLEPLPAVQSPPQSQAMLVHTVNLVATEETVQLTFCCVGAAPASDSSDAMVLILRAQSLRQWLGILYDQYCAAQWPLTTWPDWVTEAPKAGGQLPQALLH